MNKAPTTLEEIEAIDKEMLTPADVATYLGSTQNTINNSAEKKLLPWAYKLGNRTMIPKAAFIHCHRFGRVVINGMKI